MKTVRRIAGCSSCVVCTDISFLPIFFAFFLSRVVELLKADSGFTSNLRKSEQKQSLSSASLLHSPPSQNKLQATSTEESRSTKSIALHNVLTMQSSRAMYRIATTTNSLSRSIFGRNSSNIAGGSMGRAWADKEHAAESQYFNKKDAELLAQLAGKLRNHTAPTPQSIQQEKDALIHIFAKHEVKPTDALIDEIIKFKFNH